MEKMPQKLFLSVTYAFPDMEKRDGFYNEVKALKMEETCLKEAGCEKYSYAIDAKEPLLYLTEIWESESCQVRHTKTPHFSLLGGLKAKYAAGTSIERKLV